MGTQSISLRHSQDTPISITACLSGHLSTRWLLRLLLWPTELRLILTEPAGMRPLDDFKNSSTDIWVRSELLSSLRRCFDESHRWQWTDVRLTSHKWLLLISGELPSQKGPLHVLTGKEGTYTEGCCDWAGEPDLQFNAMKVDGYLELSLFHIYYAILIKMPKLHSAVLSLILVSAVSGILLELTPATQVKCFLAELSPDKVLNL